MGKPTLAELDRRNMALLASLHNQAHPPQRYNYLDLRLRSILGAIDPTNPYLQSAWEQFVAAVVEARDQAAEEAEASSSAAAAEATRAIRRRRRGGVSSSRTAAAPYADRRPRASDLVETGPRSADILFRHPRSRLPFTPRVVETLSRPRSPSLDDEMTSPFSPRPGEVFRPAPDSYAEMFTGGRDEAAESSSEPVRPRAGNVPYDLRQIFTVSGTPASATRPTTVAPADLLGRDSSREYRSAPPDEEVHHDLDSMIADLTNGAGPGTYAEAVRRSIGTTASLHGAQPPLPTTITLPWVASNSQVRSPPLYLDPMVSRRPAEVGPITLNEGSSAWAAEYERAAARVSAAHAGTRRRRSDDYETRTSQMPPPTLRRTRRRIGEGDDRRRDSVRDSTRDTRRDGIVFPTGLEDWLSLVATDDESRIITEEMTPSAAAAAQMAALAQLQGPDGATATEAAAPPVPTTTDTTAATAATSAAATPNATQAPHTTHSGSSDRPIATLPRRLRQLAD